MNVYLIGYMGSGKTTVGRNIARRLGLQHLDLDDFLEQSYKISIPVFFSKYDEAAFRVAERQLLEKTFGLKNHIISTGGGTPCFDDNIELINNNGFSIYIRMSPKSLFDRLKVAKRPRPRIQGLSDEELFEKIVKDLTHREAYYNRAKWTVKGENIDLDTVEAKISGYLNLSS